MAETRIPLARNMSLAAFNGGTITDYSSYMKNAMVDQIDSDTGNRNIVMQRPAINMVEDASVTVFKVNGRGIYYWGATGADYFINEDTLYKAGYVTTIGTITSGTKKCSFHEIGGKLVIVDPENNEVWTVTTGGTLAQVVDLDLPTTIAGGGTALDGYLFLIDDDGVIQHSDLDDATSWDSLNFIEAEREADGGTYIARHHDHVVALGKSTIEFFWNAGNATGATISRRQDIFYNLGCPYEDAVWEDGDDIYFLGRTQRGDYGIYAISNFKLKSVSNPSFNSYLTNTYAESSFFPLVAGFSARGHNFVSVTIHTTTTTILPSITFVYDISTGIWGIWDTSMSELSAVNGFPITGWTTSTSSRFGIGLLTNGDLVTLKNTFDPIDTFDVANYIVDQDDYVVADYIAVFGTEGGSNIELLTRVTHIDTGSNKNKFGTTLEIIADHTTTAQTVTLSWSDTDHSTFTTVRTLDLSKREKLSRIGSYNRRTYQLEYSGDEIVRLEALEYDVLKGMS